MRITRTIMVAVTLIGIGVGLRHPATTAAANDGTSAAATAIAALPAFTGDDAEYSYVGSKKCKKCHLKQYKSWAATKMGHAFETLKPGQAVENRKKFNIDVDKDYTKDPTCLKCHTVGFGKAGGYKIPDLEDKKSVRTAKKREGVGCESCHGPGSEYVKVFDEIMKSKRTYKVEELYAVGMWKIDESVCKKCHNEESPTINPGDPFDYEKRKDEGTHEHHPLKQRAE